MEQIVPDFLTPDISHIRHSIQGIDDSYNNSWDIYAELLQNAVDAIRLSARNSGSISITIDCIAKSVEVVDDGIGIDPEKLLYLLKPFSTNKTNADQAIGEKGVGLKFVIFSSNDFYIKTGTGSSAAEVRIAGARNWKNSTDDDQPPLQFEKLEESFQGTIVRVAGIENENLFSLNIDQAKYVLGTKTAIGSTRPIWGSDVNISVSLTYRDINSTSSTETIPFRYWLLTDLVPENTKISLDEFEQWLGAEDRTDQDKRKKLQDKMIHKKGEFTHGNSRVIKYVALFVPQRRVWDALTIHFDLATEEKLNDEDWRSEYYYSVLGPGIYVSVKGMPTGISVDHPATGFAGYWENIFILFEDPLLKFDIGRKSIHGKTATIYRQYARDIFLEFRKYITKYVSGDIEVDPPDWDKDEIFSEIMGLLDLNADGIKFKKIPSKQEASVAALFFEAIGAGKIQDLVPLVSGYRRKYDLFTLWGTKRIVIEFKSQLAQLAKDFNDARKMFDEMDCVVCWEVTDDDQQILHKMGITVDEIKAPLLPSKVKTFPHSTHVMNISGFSKPVFVIDLKRVLKP